MPLGRVARDDAVDGQGDHDSAGLIGQQAQDALQRAHPAQIARPPAHRPGPGERADHAFQHLGHNRIRLATGLFDHGKEHLALFIRSTLQLVQRQAARPQEPLDGSRGGVGLRTLAFLAHRTRFRRQPVHRQHQTARGGERTGGGIGQTGLDQPVRHQHPQILARAGLHPRRDFLGKQFDQQIHVILRQSLRQCRVSTDASYNPDHQETPPRPHRYQGPHRPCRGRQSPHPIPAPLRFWRRQNR